MHHPPGSTRRSRGRPACRPSHPAASVHGHTDHPNESAGPGPCRAVELAVELGDLEAARRKLASLRAERAELVARLRVAPQPRGDKVLRDLALERARDFRKAVSGAPEQCRRALRVLLDGGRMGVYADAERAFRVEGVFRLALERSEPPGASSERFACEVAGARFATDETGRVPVMRYHLRARTRASSAV